MKNNNMFNHWVFLGVMVVAMLTIVTLSLLAPISKIYKNATKFDLLGIDNPIQKELDFKWD